MRVGDVLSLEWTAGNNCEANKTVGWQRDELRLVVTRGKRRFVFLVDARTGPDNSARMVRRYGFGT